MDFIVIIICYQGAIWLSWPQRSLYDFISRISFRADELQAIESTFTLFSLLCLLNGRVRKCKRKQQGNLFFLHSVILPSEISKNDGSVNKMSNVE